MIHAKNLVKWLLIIGLAYVFISFGVSKHLQTDFWVGWIPPFMEGFIDLSIEEWTRLIGVIEVIIGIGLLIPRLTKWFAILAIAHLAPVIYLTGLSGIGVRDTGLLAMAAALAVFSFQEA